MIPRFVNIILALLIFISSAGFTVNSHYCRNELKGVHIFFHPESCHEQRAKANCHKATETSCHGENTCQKGCCTNNSDYFKLEQDQQVNGFQFKTFDELVFVVANRELAGFLVNSREKTPVEYLNYKPPLPDIDYPVLLQTFLL